MKTLIIIFALFPAMALAHCPIPLAVHGQSYCADVQWLNGDRKVQGEFESVEHLSPHLVQRGEIPQRWVYSKAEIQIWQKGDRAHRPQKIEGFRIFPYMHMQNGHHHSTSYDFQWDPNTETYLVSGVAFQEMAGCWSFRWTTSQEDRLVSSQFLMNVLDYSNASDAKNHEMAEHCANAGSGEDHGEDHDHSHH